MDEHPDTNLTGAVEAMTPVSLSERIEFLDVLRGAALFGIIAANMRGFNSPQETYWDHTLMWTGTADRVAQGFIDLFISGKFVTLFSFLFGIGFAIQMDRAAARGVSPKSFYLRRLTILLLIGLAHAVLIWWGDILGPYALMGYFLFLFRNRSQRSILRWSLGLYAYPLVINLAMLAAHYAGFSIPMPPSPGPEELQRVIGVYTTGSYFQIVAQHVKELPFNLAGLVFFYPRVLGIFLFGLWVWREGILRDLGSRVEMLRNCQAWGLWLGILGNAATVAISEVVHPNPMLPSAWGSMMMLTSSLGMPAGSLFYASSLALIYRDPAWQARLHSFAAVGRTALSNYLLQSVVCTTLYNSWGFALYGSVGPMVGLVPTILIFGLQLPLSVWWTRRFAFGPMEWVWRSLTYGRSHLFARGAATVSS